MDIPTWFLICLALSAILIVLRLAARKAEKGFHKRLDDDIIYGVDDIPYNHRLDQMRDKFRADNPHAPRFIGKHPALGAPYGKAPPPERQSKITLTPRQLERVNIQRKLQGRAPLNRNGFSNAVAHAWDQPRRQPDTSSDWLTYLIMYEVLLGDHTSSRTACDTSITISPDEPYNGHGGEFAGAGASGDWTSAPTATAVVAAAIALSPDPLSDPGSYKGGDVSSSDTPSYSASLPSDNSSSYSSPSSPDTSSPSSSSDSGSSSSDGGGGGGGDGGGGGGGGGD